MPKKVFRVVYAVNYILQAGFCMICPGGLIILLGWMMSYRWGFGRWAMIASIVLGVLLLVNPFDAMVSVVMLCGVLLILEGAINLGCTLYAAMELRTLERMANAAANAALSALADAADEDDTNPDNNGVVYDAESTDVTDTEQ